MALAKRSFKVLLVTAATTALKPTKLPPLQKQAKAIGAALAAVGLALTPLAGIAEETSAGFEEFAAKGGTMEASGASARRTAANAAPMALACFWIVGSFVGRRAVVAAATSSRRLAGAIIALPQLQVLEAAALQTAALHCNQLLRKTECLQLVVVCTAQ